MGLGLFIWAYRFVVLMVVLGFPISAVLAWAFDMNNNSRSKLVWRALVAEKYTYAVTGDAEYALWKNGSSYQSENLIDASDTLAIFDLSASKPK